MKVERTVCDKCRRSANGQSPDSIAFLRCGHDICNECSRKNDKCPICGKVRVVGRSV